MESGWDGRPLPSLVAYLHVNEYKAIAAIPTLTEYFSNIGSSSACWSSQNPFLLCMPWRRHFKIF